MLKRPYVLILLLGLSIAPFGSGGHLHGQDPDIAVVVRRVNLLVTVVDRSGRFVTDLERDRFQVFEDGKRQDLTNFGRQTDLPLDIALLIDTSASIRTQFEFEKRAATQFLHSVMTSKDRALLVEFDRGVTLIQDFTDRPGELAEGIRGLRSGGGTALIDAVHSVTEEKMATRSSARKVIILISDGSDRNSDHTLQDALKVTQTTGVAVYAVGTNKFSADQRKKGIDLLEDLTEKTGGRAFFPHSIEQLEAAFEAINDELRSQYFLAYSPSNELRDGAYRKLRVKIRKGRGIKARHRAGYYAPSPEESGR